MDNSELNKIRSLFKEFRKEVEFNERDRGIITEFLAWLQLEKLNSTEELFYIQAEGYVGNSMSWWRPIHRGYTTQIDKAGRYDKEDADNICSNPGRKDVAWPVEYIDGIAEKHVDMQDADPDKQVKF